jgi:magnesium transporter
MQHNLKSATVALPYEFRALESILLSVLSALEAELVFLRALVGGLLAELEDDIDRDRFKRLLHAARRLAGFQNRARLVQAALEEVLEQGACAARRVQAGAERAQTRTSRRCTSPSAGAACRARTTRSSRSSSSRSRSRSRRSRTRPRRSRCRISARTLRDLPVDPEGPQSKRGLISRAQSNVQSTQEIVELILDSNRNALLALDLKVCRAPRPLSPRSRRPRSR